MLDERAAEAAERFFPTYLRHVEGEWAGQPFRLMRWQRDIVRKVFGEQDANGLRAIRTVYVEVPRKQGKSTLAAGLALRQLLADREVGAQVYIAATDRDQAGIIYRVAERMVLASPELRAITQLIPSRKRILFPQRGSLLAVLPGDAFRAHGINASTIIFDELHAQRTRELYDVLKTSQGARRQPLFVMLTTAGFDEETICGEEHDYAGRVRDGIIQEPSYLPVIYAADSKDDWADPATWKKANPSWDELGPTFQRGIADAARRAADDPGSLNSFLRLHLNIWTKQETRWLPMEAWDRSAGIVVPEKLRGRPCYGGLDMSSTEDLTAFALVFPPTDGDPNDDGRYEVLVWFFCPEETAHKRERSARVPYPHWITEGFIRATPGNVVDYAAVHKLIVQQGERFDIRQINFDPWNAGQISQDLSSDGFTCVPMQQAYRTMSAPTKELLRLVLAGRLAHGGNPVLRWNADNLVVRQDPDGNVRPAKDKKREKIDGIVALVMALDGAIRNRAEPSVYSERGILSI